MNHCVEERPLVVNTCEMERKSESRAAFAWWRYVTLRSKFSKTPLMCRNCNMTARKKAPNETRRVTPFFFLECNRFFQHRRNCIHSCANSENAVGGSAGSKATGLPTGGLGSISCNCNVSTIKFLASSGSQPLLVRRSDDASTLNFHLESLF